MLSFHPEIHVLSCHIVEKRCVKIFNFDTPSCWYNYFESYLSTGSTRYEPLKLP